MSFWNKNLSLKVSHFFSSNFIFEMVTFEKVLVEKNPKNYVFLEEKSLIKDFSFFFARISFFEMVTFEQNWVEKNRKNYVFLEEKISVKISHFFFWVEFFSLSTFRGSTSTFTLFVAHLWNLTVKFKTLDGQTYHNSVLWIHELGSWILQKNSDILFYLVAKFKLQNSSIHKVMIILSLTIQSFEHPKFWTLSEIWDHPRG